MRALGSIPASAIFSIWASVSGSRFCFCAHKDAATSRHSRIADTAASILLFTETLKQSDIFLQKMPPRMIFSWQNVNRNRFKQRIGISLRRSYSSTVDVKGRSGTRDSTQKQR